MLKKILTIGIIILFLGVVIQPAIATPENTVEISVSRYSADSSIEKSKVMMSKERVLELRDELKDIESLDDRFSLFKEYGLIPDDVTRDSLRQEMLELADELGFTDEKIESISKRFKDKKDNERVIGINFLNYIEGAAFFTFNLPVGISLLAGLFNLFMMTYWGNIYNAVESIDLLYANLFIYGRYNFTDGMFSDFSIPLGVGFFTLLGFYGYVFSSPILSPLAMMFGFSIYTLAIPVNME